MIATSARQFDRPIFTYHVDLIRISTRVGQPCLSPLADRLRGRSEFARSSRKFRVRGRSHESELRGKAPYPSASPPCGEAPSPRPSPRKRGEGAERAAHTLML